MNTKKLRVTVGITTCYGGESIINTVKSVRNSTGIDEFNFILIADRVPISDKIKKELVKYHVQLVENKTEGTQVKKQKQMLAMVKTELIVFTQDDVLIDPDVLSTVVKYFSQDLNLTMASIYNSPVEAKNIFEDSLGVGTNIANYTAQYWKNGDNYLSVIGRFVAFRTDFIRRKFRMMDTIITSDAYYYFENKYMGGTYKYIPEVAVYFRNPQNLEEHMRKSSRFQYSQKEMSRYFKDIQKEYSVPKTATIRALMKQFFYQPLKTISYFLIYGYTRLMTLEPSAVMKSNWEVDLSTKNVV